MTEPAAALAVARADDHDLQATVGTALRGEGAVVVRGVEVTDDPALLEVVALVGRASAVGNGGREIYDVTPREGGTDLSSTAEQFPLHTDSTFLTHPHPHIALGCVTAPPAGGGGRSCVVSADVLARALADRHGPDAVAALREPAFPFILRDPGEEPRVALLPVLGSDDDGRTTIRYRADAVEMAARADGHELGERHRSAFAALTALTADESLQRTFALAPGDVLLVDNRRMLHGRSAIQEGAQRLLRRVKTASASAPAA